MSSSQPRMALADSSNSGRAAGSTEHQRTGGMFRRLSLKSSSGSHAPHAKRNPKNTSTTMTNSSNSNSKPSFRLLRRNRKKQLKGLATAASKNQTNVALSSANSNALIWLELECPDDVLPKVLAYCGPQKAAALNRTNRFWNALLSDDGTWKVLCTELYKWTPEQEEPSNWREYYCRNPCVPVDYRSIERAFQLATRPNGEDVALSFFHPRRSAAQNNSPEPVQDKSVRILLRPGRHFLRETINIRGLPGVNITMETMTMPKNLFYKCPTEMVEPMEQALPLEQDFSNSSLHSHSSSSGSLRQRLSRRSGRLRGCSRGSSSSVVGDAFYDETEQSESSQPDDEWLMDNPPTRARIVFRGMRKPNEPALCIRMGSLKLQNIELYHTSCGADIWSGNAAIHVQPSVWEDREPLGLGEFLRDPSRPTVTIQQCRISSRTGRGVVTIDGGHVGIHGCAILDCAATGLYVGGQGSQAWMTQSDILGCGVGNSTTRRGIARGHSGVYLEQGLARIETSNISDNVLTGISAVSHDNAILELTRSDLVRNGTCQIEVPPLGSRARRESILDQNRLENVEFHSKSGLVPEHWTSPVSPQQLLFQQNRTLESR